MNTGDKKRHIAFISSNIGSLFVSNVVRGVEQKIKEIKNKKYILNHFHAGIRENDIDSVIMDVIKDSKITGIIILSILPGEKSYQEIINQKIPTVIIERKIKNIHSIMIDNFKSGYEVGKKIISKKRKKIGIIIDQHTDIEGMATNQRFAGFKKALQENNIKLNSENIVRVNLHTIEEGRIAFEKIEKKLKNIDTIFCVAGDIVAVGFMLEAKANGIKIPDDIAIIGFDDIEMASAVEPQLTTVRQPIFEMGGLAIELLDDVINGKLNKTKNIVLNSQFISRETF